MNGWVRLWLFLTAIWAVVVVGFAAIMAADTYDDPDGPWIVYRLSDDAKPFFKDSTNSDGPTFTVGLSFEDGTTNDISFPLLDSTDLQSLESKIRRFADREGKRISESEFRRFSSAVVQKNNEAEAASLQYRLAVAQQSMKQSDKRKTTFQIAALVLVVPPLVLLTFGFGIAWVRRGFHT